MFLKLNLNAYLSLIFVQYMTVTGGKNVEGQMLINNDPVSCSMLKSPSGLLK